MVGALIHQINKHHPLEDLLGMLMFLQANSLVEGMDNRLMIESLVVAEELIQIKNKVILVFK
jgi:hypothetical protein